jgi:hypothetical protein
MRDGAREISWQDRAFDTTHRPCSIHHSATHTSQTAPIPASEEMNTSTTKRCRRRPPNDSR